MKNINSKEVTIKVYKIIKQNLGFEYSDSFFSNNLMDIGMDSMSYIRLIVALETEFNIIFDDFELLYKNFQTIDDIVRRVNMKLTSRKAIY